MFDASNDSVQIHTIGEPIIKGSEQLYRLEHFDSEFQGCLRQITFPKKHRQNVEKMQKIKKQQSIPGCLDILSYDIAERKDDCQLKICLYPAVKRPLFEILKNCIQKQCKISEHQLSQIVLSLISTIRQLQKANAYRDINFWNVFYDDFGRVVVGDLSELDSMTPISRLFGCSLDYASTDTKDKNRQMAYGLALIILGFTSGSLPKFLSLNKKSFHLSQCRNNFGWQYYELVACLLQKKCSEVDVQGIMKKRITVRFKDVSVEECDELTIYECQKIKRIPKKMSKITVKFTTLQRIEEIWDDSLKSFNIQQCSTNIGAVIKLKGIRNLIELSLVNVSLRQCHLKYLVKQDSNVKFLDISMNRQLTDWATKIIIDSSWLQKLEILKMGGPDSGCNLTNKSIELFLGASKRTKSMHFLDLSWNPFTQQVYRLLLDNFHLLQHITQINMTRTPISQPEPTIPNIIV